MKTINNKTMMAGEYDVKFDIKPFIIEYKRYNGSLIDEVANQDDFIYIMEAESGSEHIIVFKHRESEVYVEVHSEEVCGVTKCYLECINKTDKDLYITAISSGLVSGVFGNISEKKCDDLFVCYLKNSWCAEGELVKESLSRVYLPLINERSASSVKTISSKSTYTTRNYFPIAYFLDEKSQSCVAVEIIPYSNWNISMKVDRIPHKDYKTLTVYTSSADGNRDDFYVKLASEEKHTTCVSLIAESDGIEGCVALLNEYKRKKDRVSAKNLVIFNDYMNCNWAVEEQERTKKLIDRAVEIGCQVYCMDSGWYKAKDEKDWFGVLGDWKENDGLFGENGFKGIIDYAAERGIIMGMWFELDVCTKNSEVAKNPDDWFVCYNGKRVFTDGRYYFNLSNEKVRKYLVSRVKYFYDQGVRYIKNDYNGTYPTCDYNSIGGEGATEVYNRYITVLYKEIRKACPGIIIENCASGAMRADHSVLSYSDLQSFSDNELYYNYPAIVSGSLMYQLPEKIGVWASVYPQLYEFYKDESFLTKEYVREHGNGEETIFSLVTAFFGIMYLSGRIDVIDDNNLRLLKEGVALRKAYNDFIANSNPYYPDGDISFYKKSGIVKLGLKNGNKMLLAVWRLNGGENETEIIGNNIKQIYPLGAQLHKTTENGIRIKFTKAYQARLYELDI